MAPPSLLGPPELYAPAVAVPLQPSQPQPTESTAAGDPFVDALVANFNKIDNPDDNLPPMGFTENMSVTFLSTGNPCLDFFFHVVPDTPADSLIERLSLAWNHNPLMTLKLICNLRGVRGTGKSDKEGYYTAALWLHKFHPKTLAGNIPSIADFGYFKDLPEILYRLLEGSDVRKNQKNEWFERKRGGRNGKRSLSIRRGRGGLSIRNGSFKQEKPKTRKKEIQSSTDREVNISKAMETSRIEKEKASAERKIRKVSMAKKVVERFESDPSFQLLYDRISDFFADCLKSDLQFLNSGELRKISLAAKWCPSVDSSFDRSTLLCESIARKIFPRESDPEYEGIEEAHYAYRVRDRLRKQVLVPLRKVLELPEVYIGANRWDSIPYNRVASVAMKNYKEKFMQHDGERFGQYLKDVKDGKTKIAAGALLPHGASESSTPTTSTDDSLSMPLPTIQSFKAAASSSSSTKERKRIRWADESGEELVKVKLIESWRDLVPYDPRHDDQSFKDAKLREHANERNALLAQHHKVPPAVAASKSREWSTPAFIRLPEAVAARVNGNSVTDEMHVQDSRRRHVDEYVVLAGEMPIQSPKEWERVNEPHRGPPLEIPLSDVVESQPSSVPPASTPMMAPPTSAAPSYSREGYSSTGYGQAPGYDQRGYNDRSEYNGRQDSEADRKLREALGPLQENTVALLMDNPDVVPQVLDEAQRNGNRIPDARVFEIVDQYRRGRYQPPPNAGGPAYSPYGSQQQYGGDMGPGVGYDRQYQQQYPPQQGAFIAGKRKAEAMGAPQNGMLEPPQSLKRPSKKTRGTLPCRYFASPIGCKHGANCHYAHVQPVPANGPEHIYNNNGPMMGGRGAGPMMGGPPPMDRYGPVSGMPHGVPQGLPGPHMRGGR